MRYFFNIVRDGRQLQDFEGAEFDSDGDAETEGRLVAREIIGRQLIAGIAVDWASTVEILRTDNSLVAAFSFRQALDLPQVD